MTLPLDHVTIDFGQVQRRTESPHPSQKAAVWERFQVIRKRSQVGQRSYSSVSTGLFGTGHLLRSTGKGGAGGWEGVYTNPLAAPSHSSAPAVQRTAIGHSWGRI